MRRFMAFIKGVMQGIFSVLSLGAPVTLRINSIPVERGLFLDSKACGKSVHAGVRTCQTLYEERNIE